VKSGAQLVGIDIAPYFAAEARAGSHLILGDLRRLPLRDGVFTKAWSLDVLEHLSLDALRGMLTEAHRVLADRGGIFIYTHVRKNGWPAAGVRAANRLARGLERVGLLDLRLERLRKSDHVNPLADHDQLASVVAECGFEIERITYYTPVTGAFVENVLVRLGERWLGRRRRTTARDGAPGATDVDTLRAGRLAAQQKVRQGGAIYRGLVALTAFMKIDLLLFGRVKSGPFFALLRRTPSGPRPMAQGPRQEPAFRN
jgi:SAM-dependent methyltransferase